MQALRQNKVKLLYVKHTDTFPEPPFYMFRFYSISSQSSRAPFLFNTKKTMIVLCLNDDWLADWDVRDGDWKRREHSSLLFYIHRWREKLILIKSLQGIQLFGRQANRQTGKLFCSHCNLLRNQQCVAMFGQKQQKHTHATFAIAVCSVHTGTSRFTQFVPRETFVISFWYGR